MAAAAPGWNQFYLYQSPPLPPPPPPSSVSRNPPHAAEQPGEKLMCFPIMKWYTAKNKFKKVPGLSPTAVQHSFNLLSGFKHSFGLTYASQLEFIAEEKSQSYSEMFAVVDFRFIITRNTINLCFMYMKVYLSVHVYVCTMFKLQIQTLKVMLIYF